jgi:hypothetical protein
MMPLRLYKTCKSQAGFVGCIDHGDSGLVQSKIMVCFNNLRAGWRAENRTYFPHPTLVQPVKQVRPQFAAHTEYELVAEKLYWI